MYYDILFQIIKYSLPSFLVCLLINPIVVKISTNFHLQNKPNPKRISDSQVPLSGISILISFGLVLYALTGIPPDFANVFVCLILIAFIGLIDDFISLRSIHKFFWPLLICTLAVYFGTVSSFLPYPLLNYIISLLWIYGLTNSINFLDNMDGIATGVSSISALSFGILSIKLGFENLSILSFVLFGSCMGFLIFNFPSAKCYLGDAGSLSLGFLLSCIGLNGTWSDGNEHYSGFIVIISIPVMIMGYTIFDTAYVVLSRIYNRKRPWLGDTNHTTHKLLKIGYSPRQICLFVYLLSIIFSFFSYVILEVTLNYVIILVIMNLAIVLMSTWYFNKIPFEV